MKDRSKISGACLCGSVQVQLDSGPDTYTVCHCDSCRRWSGGIPMSFNAGEHLKFEGEEYVGRFQSSDWAERGFCKNCGTHLFFRLKKTDHYFLYAGLFGDKISPKLEMQEFIDEKPSYYELVGNSKTLTRNEAHHLLEKYLSRPIDKK